MLWLSSPHLPAGQQIAWRQQIMQSNAWHGLQLMQTGLVPQDLRGEHFGLLSAYLGDERAAGVPGLTCSLGKCGLLSSCSQPGRSMS